MSGLRIFVIDDHAMFRCGLSMMLRAELSHAEIVEAGSLNEAMRADVETPAVVLLDIELQGLNGMECIPVLQRRWPQTPIVMLSSNATPSTIRQALERGAAAFVGKADTAATLIAAIHAVLHKLPGWPNQQGAEAKDCTIRLTPRQCEVLDLLGQGLPNKTIGKRLGLSENTVRGHVQALLGVLQVSSRSEAAFAARQLGLLS